MDSAQWAANKYGIDQMKNFLKSTTVVVTLIGAMALLTGTAEARNVHARAKHEISQVKQDKADAKAAAKQDKAAAKQANADAKAAAKQAKADAKGVQNDDTVSSDDQGDDAVGSDDQGDDLVGSNDHSDDVVGSDDQGDDGDQAVDGDDDQGDDMDVADETDVEGVED